MRLSLTVVIATCWFFNTVRASEIPGNVRGLLQQYCGDCHSGDDAELGVRFDQGVVTWNVQSLERWEHAHQLLSRRIMPPADSDQLPDAQRQTLLDWIDRSLIEHGPIGGTRLRRLNRREYTNTIKSLFDLSDFQLPVGFPADNEANGFDNQGSALVLSGAHLDALSETATSVADQFFPPLPKAVEPQSQHFGTDEMVISYSSACLIDGAMRLGSSGANVVRHATWPTSFESPAAGVYQIAVTVSRLNPPEGVTPLLSVEAMQLSDRSKLRLIQELPVDQDGPQTLKVRATLYKGDTVVFRYSNGPMNYDEKADFARFLRTEFLKHPKLAAAWGKIGQPARGGNGWLRLKEAMADPELDATEFASKGEPLEKLVREVSSNPVRSGETLVYKYFEQGPNLGLHDITIHGPTELVVDPEVEKRKRLKAKLLGEFAGTADESSLRRFFDDWLSRAFRRPATDREVERYVGIALAEAGGSVEGRTIDRGLHLAIRTALISPAFLYREIAPGKLSDHELASRLAFFLTSNPPDEGLRKLADAGELQRADVLRREAKRLVRKDFATDFCRGWLGLDVVETLMPDARLIRRFKPEHRRAMLDEVTETFFYILKENLPVRDFIAPDFMFTDPVVGWDIYEMAEFKPPKKKQGPKFKTGMQRISVSREGRRGGLLGMSAVMMATANGVDTQPVLRGVWVLENLFGTPPPEPPKAVPALTPDTAGASSPRQRLAAHMADPSCAACHRDIDPLGFVLENFDPIGRWREHYPVYKEVDGISRQEEGLPIDSTGLLADGAEINDVTDLKGWLAENPEILARCLSEKLLTYATGRKLSYREREIVAVIVEEQKSNDLRFHDLLLALIDTEIFRTK